MDRKDHVNTSSFLNLQSEYFSERAKFDFRKGLSRNLEKPVRLKNIKKTFDDSNHNKQTPVDGDEWEKSRTALEKKARLYDELSNRGKGASSGCVSDDHLIDFAQKISCSEPSVILRPENFVSKLLEPESEFIDEFGRTRKIKKGCNDQIYDHDNVPTQEFYHDRSDLRTLGIGFYRFSYASAEKRDQMKNLNSRRLETVNEREGYAQLLLRRKEYRIQRVAVALARKQRLSQSS
jgi:hypothetical protein